MTTATDAEPSAITAMTAHVAAAYFSNHNVPPERIGDVMKNIHGAFVELGKPPAPPEPERKEPAVPVKKSVTPDFIICLEDGKKLKMLKRHLKTVYNMSPNEYRAKWNLPPDYPMVAPNYAKERSEMAKRIGLGTSRKKEA